MNDKTPPVYENTVDGHTWYMKVVRTEPYRGVLTVIHVATDSTILVKHVVLSYDAIFGPDVADVADWQRLTLTAIDNQGVLG